jgi:hypothetical protein
MFVGHYGVSFAAKWVAPAIPLFADKGVFIVALAMLSHWILDLVVHRPDR